MLALLMARAISRGELVKSESRSTLTSKEMRKASSFGSEDFAEEARTGVLLEWKDVRLAAAGVQQYADGEGQVLLLRQVLDGLRIVVFGYLAVVLAKAGDEASSCRARRSTR